MVPKAGALPEEVLATSNDLALALGHFVMRWNGVETSLRWMVDTIAGVGATGEILIARMSTIELCDVAVTLVIETKQGRLLDEVKHAVEFVDRLRNYRNYYAHEPTGTLVVTDIGLVAAAFRTSNKGGLRRRISRVSVKDLKQAEAWANQIGSYLGLVSMQFARFDDETQRPPLGERPPLPPKLDLPYTNGWALWRGAPEVP